MQDEIKKTSSKNGRIFGDNLLTLNISEEKLDIGLSEMIEYLSLYHTTYPLYLLTSLLHRVT